VQIPLLPVAIGGIVLTFALAVLGWWIASHVERRRRTARRAAETDRLRNPDVPPASRRGVRGRAAPRR
jgi:lipopolysaccharide export LptBFGC system permease protein LptF